MRFKFKLTLVHCETNIILLFRYKKSFLKFNAIVVSIFVAKKNKEKFERVGTFTIKKELINKLNLFKIVIISS